ncbi:hypothetical protein J3369_08405 [Alteromonas sp. NFXS44]|uniref:hypothetical protein n=1 Tax=Alteromonas sp. NFXS44 TaxID=2818435 RepID=UPI0032DFEC05
MKFLKTKHRPLPSTSFERLIHSQPVFNWFDRYDKSDHKAGKATAGAVMAEAATAK